MTKNRKIKFSKWKFVLSAIILCVLAVVLVFAEQIQSFVGFGQKFNIHQKSVSKISAGDYKVSYIDVGQGSATLIELPDGKNMLIDGGDTEYGETVAKFLTDRNILVIDYMVASHADSDHIGGLNYILDNFEVKNIYRPFQISMRNKTADEISSNPSDTSKYVIYENDDLSGIYEHLNGNKFNKVTTMVYRNFIDKIYSETYTLSGLTQESKVTVFYDGLKIVGEDYSFEFYAPLLRDEDNNMVSNINDAINISNYTSWTFGYATLGYTSNSNDNSAILLFSCGEDKYFFMGDARFTTSDLNNKGYSEFDFIVSLTDEEKLELSKIDVLLLAHHGSKFSTSDELLEILEPRFVVVSAGKDYGHPHDETIDRVSSSSNIEKDYLLRTDINGDIIFSKIDGELAYSLETQGNEEKLALSFRLLAISLAVISIIVIFSIKEKHQTEKN